MDGNAVVTADETGLTGQTSQVLTELRIAMESSIGVAQGEVVIDKDGIRVLDSAGDLVSQFDEGGSLHTAPETFTGSLSANLANVDGTPTLAGVRIDGTGIDFTSLEGLNLASISTSADEALELGVQGQRAMRFENLGTSPNVIGGHSGNQVTALAIGATIAGGGSGSNLVTDNFGFIGGGDNNQAGNNNADPADAPYAVVGGGLDNTASGDRSAITGGFGNQATDTFASVGGGELNLASAETARVGGGDNNSATAIEATVAGGGGNLAGASGATVSGGLNNTASGFESAIGGGESNTASNSHATVSGGNFNQATFNFATVGGGQQNVASGLNSTVSGGESNSAVSHATVGGGQFNDASGLYTSIGGGQSNVASAAYGTIAGGGRLDTANALTANRVTDDYGVVGGGANNQAGDGLGTTVDRKFATVGGGESNIASGNYAAVGGGFANEASDLGATAGGGFQNDASGIFSTIGGGLQNEAIGQGSTVPGGQANSAGANFSFAAGFRARIDPAHAGAILLSDSSPHNFTSTASNEFAVRATGGARIVSSVDGTTGAPTAGVTLAPGGGSWGALSDRNAKANFSTVDKLDLLELLDEIPVETWNYKTQDPSLRHIGPVSQDFYQAFGLGADDTRITSVDATGVNMAAIQGLHQLSKDKDMQIDALLAQVESLEARLSKLEGRTEDGELLGGIFGSRLPMAAAAVMIGLLLGAVVLGRRWSVRG